ncbi:hypothetical protein TTHERM_00242430 (macronuclear) [Tetrahymena thermophila SB210]|uniref:Transmembrane protein n=1 Tax=Tetrahymena thermophila (strain SB210) TaxID=312017 RepID=I7MIT3_TETTS|nr:hypothetical protein TTHERM_00242430 [Tetrahymena thermophila SB210]EAS04721.1 hypothetical protein TTHERM_00242430 [Tetrahymena thermophila SB210]|eukprot:XP_001024966.1 hypothetical protein TTHERM_00242430 [Tetrahymena thermophila SB210]
MKSIYITLALISLLAFTQAADPQCQKPTCADDPNPQECQDALSKLESCVQTSCTNIQAGDFQAILTCFTTCKPTYQPLIKKFEDYAECQISTNPQIAKLVKCVEPSLLGCQNNPADCQTAFQAQGECIANKCPSVVKSQDDLDGIQKCIFSTCKSSSSIVNNAEKQIYECVTGKKVSVSAQILISSVFTLIGYLILF